MAAMIYTVYRFKPFLCYLGTTISHAGDIFAPVQLFRIIELARLKKHIKLYLETLKTWLQKSVDRY